MRNDHIKALVAQEFFMLHPKAMHGLEAFVNGNVQDGVETKSADNGVITQIFNNVAVISIEGAMYKKGTVGMCMSVLSYQDIKIEINKVEKNEAIDTTVYIVDTPGGTVDAGADEVSDLILKSSKKTIAIVKNMMASGGMWIFSACDEIYASTNIDEFGSIGVKGGFLEETEDDKKVYKAVSRNAKNKYCSLNGKCKEKLDSKLNTIEDEFYARLLKNTGKEKEFFIKEFNEGDTIHTPRAIEIGFIKGVVSVDSFIESLVIGAVPAGAQPKSKPAAKQIQVKGEAMAEEQITQEQLDQAVAQAAERATNISAIGAKYGVSSEMVHTAIQSKVSVEDFQTQVMDSMQEQLKVVGDEKTELQSKLDEAIKLGASEDNDATNKPVEEETEKEDAVLAAARQIEV